MTRRRGLLNSRTSDGFAGLVRGSQVKLAREFQGAKTINALVVIRLKERAQRGAIFFSSRGSSAYASGNLTQMGLVRNEELYDDSCLSYHL